MNRGRTIKSQSWMDSTEYFTPFKWAGFLRYFLAAKPFCRRCKAVRHSHFQRRLRHYTLQELRNIRIRVAWCAPRFSLLFTPRIWKMGLEIRDGWISLFWTAREATQKTFVRLMHSVVTLHESNRRVIWVLSARESSTLWHSCFVLMMVSWSGKWSCSLTFANAIAAGFDYPPISFGPTNRVVAKSALAAMEACRTSALWNAFSASSAFTNHWPSLRRRGSWAWASHQ